MSFSCRYESYEEGQRNQRPGLPLHFSDAIRGGHCQSTLRRARRVREGLLRHHIGCHPSRSQRGQILRPQPAPVVAQDPQRIGFDAFRRLRGPSVAREAASQEAGKGRTVQGTFSFGSTPKLLTKLIPLAVFRCHPAA